MKPGPKRRKKIRPGDLPRTEVEGVRQDLIHGILSTDEHQAIERVHVTTPRIRAKKKFKAADPRTQETMIECARKRRARALRYIFNPEEGESVV
jgi:hypothetical protein